MKRLNGKLHNTYAKPGMMKLSKPFSLDVELSCLVGWVSYPVRTCQHSWCTLYFLVSTPNQSHVCFPPQIQIFQYLCLKKKNTQKVISFLEFRWFFCCSISLGAKFFGFLVSLWKSDQVSSPHPRYLFKIKFSSFGGFKSHEFEFHFWVWYHISLPQSFPENLQIQVQIQAIS